MGNSLTAEQIPTPVADDTSTCTAWGITFGYWVSPQIPGWHMDLAELIIAETTVFTAVFSMWVGSCTITLFRNDGSVGADNVFTRIGTDHGMIMHVPAPPTRVGYIFAGWATDAAGNYPFDLSVGAMSEGCCMYLYAQWKPEAILYQQVFFHGNGGSPATQRVEFVLGETYGALFEQIQAPTKDGGWWEFIGWFTAPRSGTLIRADDIVTVDSPRVLYALWSEPGTGPSRTAIFDSNGGHPEIQAAHVVGSPWDNPTMAHLFEQVIEPSKEGYRFIGWFRDGKQLFANDPAGDAVAQWEPSPINFCDVAADRWYHDYIQFIAHHNIMRGTGGNYFSPGNDFSRAMLATTLWRMADEPAGAAQPGFQDVAPGRWYSDAVAWAFDKGVVEGMGPTTFAPADAITREQFAAMLFRYANATGVDTTVPDTFDWVRFTDRHTTSDWAENAMRWAVYNGLIAGTSDTTLSPQGNATRAQSAAILMRFMQAFGT